MKVQFKNLDGIRFFAAFMVLISHAFFFKDRLSLKSIFLDKWFEDAGRIGVNLFFVLSGFLISYLLIKEKDLHGTISYKKFYVRRILRIWPLYLVLGTASTILSSYILEKLHLATFVGWHTTLINLLFLVFFAVNFQLAFFNDNRGIFEISWSVCIEEQFYLIWPILINIFRKRLLLLFVIMFFIRNGLRVLIYLLPHFTHWKFEDIRELNYVLLFDKLDLFAGGMLFAWVYDNREKWKKFMSIILNKYLQGIMILLTALYCLSILRPANYAVFYFSDHIINIILFGYLLLSAVSAESIINLEHPLLKTLGKISYGIYLFHPAVCQLLFILFSKIFSPNHYILIYYILYPIVCTAATGIIAYISYEKFEKYFLVKKARFSTIVTRI